MVSEQQDSLEQKQKGKNWVKCTTPAVGTKNGGMLNKVLPKNKDGNDERSSKSIGMQNLGHQDAVTKTRRLTGRNRSGRNRNVGVGRGSGKLLIENSSRMLPEGMSGGVELGSMEGALRRRNHQKKWSDGDNIPLGSTDLGQRRYSVAWLLQRRNFKATAESCFDIPEQLNKRLHSPKTQKRRYPFDSTPIIPKYGSGNDADEAVPAWMEETDNSEINFNFRVLGKDDKRHWEKFGKVKDVDDVRLCTIADYDKNETNEQEYTKIQFITENDNRMMNPLTQNDIMQAFSGISNGDISDKNNEIFNPDNIFGADQPSLPKARIFPEQPVREQKERDVNRRPIINIKEMPNPDQLTQISQEKRDFLYSLMKGKEQSVGHQSVNRTGTTQKEALSNTAVYASDLEVAHGRESIATTIKKNQAPTSPHIVSEMRHGPHLPSHQQISCETQQRKSAPRRFSNSSLKENEKQKLSQMIHEKLKKYSVAPSKLAYVSRSASKAVKVELESLGYLIVPSPNCMDTSITRDEKAILSFQHEIRKQYQFAIYRANEEATKYREYQKKRNLKKLMRKL